MEIRKIAMILLGGIAALVAGCNKPDVPTGGKGDPVEFTVSSAAQTRTSYEAYTEGTKETRINWVDDDRILIYGPAAVVSGTTDKHYSVYKPVEIEAESDRVSRAKVQNTGGERGLVWGEDTEMPTSFFGMVPATAFTAVTSGDYSVVKATMPAAQTLGTDGTTGMDYAFLLAAVQQQTYGTKVTMDFDPYFTAFEFIIGAEEGITSLTVNSITLASTSTALAGEFTLTGDAANKKWTASGFATDAKSITVTVGETVSGSTKIDVTFFAVPQDLTDLSATFNIDYTDANGTYQGVNRTLNLKQNGAPIVFPACHKAYIKGVLLPSSVWQYTFNPAVDGWQDVDTDPLYI